MTKFLIAIALALMSVSTFARAASASDDSSLSVCQLDDLPDIATLGEEAGPPTAIEGVAADVARDTFAPRAARAAELVADDLARDAVSTATPLAVPIEQATTFLSMPGEVHDDSPIPSRREPYRAEVMDRHAYLKATAIERGPAVRRPARE